MILILGSGRLRHVVDTGIDYNHPDIASNIWINTKQIPGNGIDDDHNGYIDHVRGRDFIGSSYLSPQQSNDPIDHFGHGTHVGGSGGNQNPPPPNPNGTPSGTYSVPVSATGHGGVSHPVTAALKVN
jgi:subtilisin family serine protease